MIFLVIAFLVAAAGLFIYKRIAQPDEPESGFKHVVTYGPRESRPKRKLSEKERIHAIRKAATRTFLDTKEKAKFVGSKQYIWRSARDSDVCATCAKNHGKKFAWDAELPHGHPGECIACPSGYCRCYAEPIIPN